MRGSLLLSSFAAAVAVMAGSGAQAQQSGLRLPPSSAAPSSSYAAPALMLSQAEAAIAAGDDRRAESLLSQTPQPFTNTIDVTRAQLLRAQISLARGQNIAALQALPAATPQQIPALGERIEATRARALFQLGDPLAATRALVLRERFLGTDAATLDANRRMLWQNLSRLRISNETLALLNREDDITRGWLELAYRQQQGGGYGDWAARHPRHPGLAQIPGAIPASAALASAAASAAATPTAPTPVAAAVPSQSPAPAYPAYGSPVPVPGYGPAPTTSYAGAPAATVATAPGRGYALLLPLSGNLARTGAAVRDGFTSAYNTAGGRAPLRTYDTGSTPQQAAEAYQQALREGAGVIVGPLEKEALTQIAGAGPAPTAVIALNYLDGRTAPPNFLQFGLAPEDEGRAAAERAANDRLLRAAVLVPANDWGQRVSAAFAARLQELGGAVVSTQRFQSGAGDFSKPIRSLVGVDASESRHRALTGVLGHDTEFEPTRRGDLDFVFLGARPSDARLLVPLLRFYRASKLPVYAASLVYGSPDPELYGVKLCDMPWITDPQFASQRSEARASYPQSQQDYPRLFALGLDAWKLTARIEQGGLRPDETLPGASGRLRLRPDNSIARELSCTTLRDGVPSGSN